MKVVMICVCIFLLIGNVVIYVHIYGFVVFNIPRFFTVYFLCVSIESIVAGSTPLGLF